MVVQTVEQKKNQTANRAFWMWVGALTAFQPAFVYAGPISNVLGVIRDAILEFLNNDVWTVLLSGVAIWQIIKWGLDSKIDHLVKAIAAAVAAGLWVIRDSWWHSVIGG